ncbi:PLP-dependent transferase [Laetiporus sulphureus 93-53]|uniref:PLP-dependent transferase n=1 Tax=Laetiporus sulphureus 93-53 TaxID=1314785 RepID=A0A165D5V6_9APHY|nr:PLP-dependent transferase [Laetiporus sulphureus 93-53]KZT04206.1 PLP-dependent transferase [Laetiporus sulphureus 93-53]
MAATVENKELTIASSSQASKEPQLSACGEAQAEKGELIDTFKLIMRDAYDAERNPEVATGVAENTLMQEELQQYFQCNLRLDFTYGDALSGSARLRTALSNLLNSYFSPFRPVSPEHIIIGAGVTSVISQVARVLVNPGDGVLIAAPYFQGFDYDLRLQNGIVPVGVPVPMSQMCTMEEVACLERALQSNKATANATRIKAVILCNPHNPLGWCYPPDVLEAYLRLCETHNLHLPSDEIYALSVFSSSDVPQPVPFTSILSFDPTALGVHPARVHVLYGMSKDFDANGFRAGALITQANARLVRSLALSAMYMAVGSPTDALWSALLNDATYLPAFLAANRTRLREAYEYTAAWLRFHGVPYIPSSAGHFLMADMRGVLTDLDRYGSILSITQVQSMEEREDALNAYFMKHKVIITPGTTYHLPKSEAGWFRITFAVRRDHVNVALRRIERAMGWKTWRGEGLTGPKATAGEESLNGRGSDQA